MYSIMLDKVSKSYQTNNYVVKAVNQADFAADKGTSVAIIGPSGSGKSTLLNMMGLNISSRLWTHSYQWRGCHQFARHCSLPFPELLLRLCRSGLCPY